MNAFQKIEHFIDTITEKTGTYISWLTSIMVLTVCFDVVTRYFFKASSVAIQELEWHIFSIIFLLGAAYTLKHDRHVRVDVFYHKMSEKNKAKVDFFGHLFLLIPFSFLVMWSSKDFIINSFVTGETSSDAGGLPFRFLIKACIPIGFFLLSLQSVSLMLKSFHKMRNEK